MSHDSCRARVCEETAVRIIAEMKPLTRNDFVGLQKKILQTVLVFQGAL